MGDAAQRRATYEDVLAAPPNMVAEVIDGILHLQPRPGKPHARAASLLGTKLGGPFDLGEGGPGGWLILFEPELHLGADILVPDLAGWRRERLPALTDDVPYFTMAPDWVCEILSRGTAKIDRTQKLSIYARESVSHVWLIDPILRTLEVLRLTGREWTIVNAYKDDARVRAEPFDARELELGILWADVKLE
jgi:Uma2 family endonuclease